MAKALKITKIEDTAAGVEVSYKFGTPDEIANTGESGVTFGSSAEFLRWILGLDENIDENLLLRLLMAQVSVNTNKTLKNNAAILGRQITVDVTAGTPIRFS